MVTMQYFPWFIWGIAEVQANLLEDSPLIFPPRWDPLRQTPGHPKLFVVMSHHMALNCGVTYAPHTCVEQYWAVFLSTTPRRFIPLTHIVRITTTWILHNWIQKRKSSGWDPCYDVIESFPTPMWSNPTYHQWPLWGAGIYGFFLCISIQPTASPCIVHLPIPNGMHQLQSVYKICWLCHSGAVLFDEHGGLCPSNSPCIYWSSVKWISVLIGHHASCSDSECFFTHKTRWGIHSPWFSFSKTSHHSPTCIW